MSSDPKKIKYTKSEAKQKMNGKNVIHLEVKDGVYTRNQVQEFVNEISKTLHKEGKRGFITVNLFHRPPKGKKHVHTGWRPSPLLKKLGENPVLYTAEDYDGDHKDPPYYQSFSVDIIPL